MSVDNAAMLVGCLLPGAYLAYTDATRYMLPHKITVPLICAGLMWGAYSGRWLETLGGAVFIFAFVLVVLTLVSALFGNPGMGGGDVWLLTGLGAWFGLGEVLEISMLACVLALVFGVGKLLYSARFDSSISVVREFLRIKEIPEETDAAMPVNAVPFGTFLVIAAWAVWILNVW